MGSAVPESDGNRGGGDAAGDIVRAPVRSGRDGASVTADTSVCLRPSMGTVEIIFLRHEPLATVQQLLTAADGSGFTPTQVENTIGFVEAARVRMEPSAAATAAFNLLGTLAREAMLPREIVELSMTTLRQIYDGEGAVEE